MIQSGNAGTFLGEVVEWGEGTFWQIRLWKEGLPAGQKGPSHRRFTAMMVACIGVMQGMFQASLEFFLFDEAQVCSTNPRKFIAIATWCERFKEGPSTMMHE